EGAPHRQGIDLFFGYNCQLLAHNYYTDHLWRNNERVELDGKTYSHDLIAGEALEFIRRNRAHPFFLYAAFTIPHSKLQIPDLGPYGNEPWPENLKTIAAMITRLDRDVGRILALVKELGLDDNTLVFFASDNGAVWRDELFNHSGPLRGYKRDMYEGGIRSPTIARWPGHIAKGATSDQVWAFWDFLPTMADLIGEKAPVGLDGISVLSALLGGPKISHPPLYYEFHERGFHQAARMGDWKAVRLGTREPIQLYDLPRDPSETTDVAASHPDVVARFDKFLKEGRTDTPVWPINEAPRGGKGAPKAKQSSSK
ncbi:MAG TPA: sulfatase-like hydrolase/transferase, partial [Opitutaceae bacterium]|nr:sulfatase-like hydrolase/transferase [Opitutaceae bacterium]